MIEDVFASQRQGDAAAGALVLDVHERIDDRCSATKQPESAVRHLARRDVKGRPRAGIAAVVQVGVFTQHPRDRLTHAVMKRIVEEQVRGGREIRQAAFDVFDDLVVDEGRR